MDNKSQKSKFATLSSCEVHHTKTTKVSAQLIEINGVPHVGLSRTYFPPGEEFEFIKPKPESKGVFLPLEAWDKFLNEAVPQLNSEIKRHQRNAPASTKSTSSTSAHQQEQSKKATSSVASLLQEHQSTSSKVNQLKRKAPSPNGINPFLFCYIFFVVLEILLHETIDQQIVFLIIGSEPDVESHRAGMEGRVRGHLGSQLGHDGKRPGKPLIIPDDGTRSHEEGFVIGNFPKELTDKYPDLANVVFNAY